MRKALIIFLIIGGLALGIGVINNLVKSGDVEPAVLQASSSDSGGIVPQLNIKEPDPVAQPTKFSIPSLNVNAMVESVGLDKENKMDIPKDEDNVAWYNLGAKPGEVGSAVVAGHLDKKTGEPAVFYDIGKLKTGDELVVEDKNGKLLTFQVTDIITYELDQFPLQEVFAKSDKPRLNLITCEGTFDQSSRLYSHRLVVYSELKES